MTTLLLDLGGTRLKAGLLGRSGEPPVATSAVRHGGDWRRAVRAAVVRHDADEVALCVPGVVDAGRVVALPDKLGGLVGADLCDVLGVPVRVVVNDAIAFGIGEAVHGAGAGAGRVLAVTLGTGVGVAVVEDGRPLGRGPLGAGLLGGQLPLGDGRTVEQACCAGALAARRELASYRDDLVRALTVLALAHAPDVVVVGGGAAQTPALLDGVGERVQAGLWPGQTVDVRLAVRPETAALTGLAVLLRDRVPA